ncbi:MAG: (Fe-S)-binding protein [Gammaproteobacteria bacterium]|nr:(Fe-S)-binding protein [Gammaproteobacteria bacterium]
MSAPPDVGLFVTCLVDLMRPSVGFASVALLEDAGCRVTVPSEQTCCGQPAYNNGDDRHARTIAERVITAFESYDYIVVPSGSCAGMLKKHYPEMFTDDPEWQQRAGDFADRCYELTSFLVEIMAYRPNNISYAGTVTYHDSCSGLRELQIKQQPRQLLSAVSGLDIVEMQDAEVCCGFGGTFCVKYPDISVKMVSDKVANIERTSAATVLSGDLGCLLNIAGRLKRLGTSVKALHVAEVLAGNGAATPGIADSE